MKNAKTLTEGPLAKQILLVSLPLALSNLLQVLFNMSDVAVVGRFAGSTALGAVGSTSIFVTLFTGFLIGLSNGINVLVARFYGAKHPGDVKKTVHSALIISFIAGVILLFVGLLGSPALLELLNTKPDLLPGAVLYLRVYFLGMPALALYNFGNAVFSAIGDTKKPLVYLSIAGALNIGLNLFFVIVCQLNVMGVALASAISQCVSAALILRALTRGDTEKISHEATVSYKDLNADGAIHAAVVTPDYRSAYPLSMVLVDEQTGAEISGRAPMGRRFFFRITNRGDIPLFVNVLDIASDGSLYDCLPIDAGGTMLHLLVPGNSTVDFRQYPMEFSEPAGTDLLVLTAYDRPFDLRRVAEALGMNRPADASPDGVGIFRMPLEVTNP